MRILMRFVVAAVLCAPVAGCAGTGQKGEWAGVVHPDELEKVGLQYYWHYSVPLDEDEAIVKLYQMEENLYCLTNRNRLLAVSATSGAVKWSRQIADVQQTVFRPSHVNLVTLPGQLASMSDMLSPGERPSAPPYDVVAINTLNEVLVLDRSDGREVRRIRLELPASAAGAVSGEYFCVGTDRGWYYSVRLWEGVRGWALAAEKTITAPLAFHDGRFYAASEDGVFYCAMAGDVANKAWSQRTNAPITAPFHVDSRGCFVPSRDGRIYAYSPTLGTELWEQPFVCNAPLRDPIQVAEKTIFQLARGDDFYAIDLATGRLRWRLPQGRLVLAAIGGDVHLLDRDKNLLIVDEMLGTTRSSLAMRGFDLFAANTKAPAVYTATTDGRLFCIRLLKAGHLTAEMLKAR